jgi:exodeoxyribonuclease-3
MRWGTYHDLQDHMILIDADFIQRHPRILEEDLTRFQQQQQQHLYHLYSGDSIVRVCSWNVNSVKVRLPHVLALLGKYNPDVLFLQETKCMDVQFPNTFHDLKYVVEVKGQQRYNGVAIIAKNAIRNLRDSLTDIPAISVYRYQEANIANIHYINLYLPCGDTIHNCESYDNKILFLKSLYTRLQVLVQTTSRIIILGDFNIIPDAKDCFNPDSTYWIDKPLRSIEELKYFNMILALGFTDAIAKYYPIDRPYTWWYSAQFFERNEGYRIDHFLVSDALLPYILEVKVLKEFRAYDKASDHAPISITLSMPKQDT